ncbi:hypothetical protein AG1IA_03153 [Rhizoctonia solani AG-1 IA]|uniref:Uncharacterized protein n=1 Tax=Thanatephorus cucumeris (strain AG1-IA) TaxID=983506 RepID=L8X2H6_THACA|nr:hypothetical protein AG1IA_03153 [Rhizoctonia solani AG-1 IA]
MDPDDVGAGLDAGSDRSSRRPFPLLRLCWCLVFNTFDDTHPQYYPRIKDYILNKHVS